MKGFQKTEKKRVLVLKSHSLADVWEIDFEGEVIAKTDNFVKVKRGWSWEEWVRKNGACQKVEFLN